MPNPLINRVLKPGAWHFNYVRFKFHSRVFMKFTYCIYMFIDSVSGLSLVLSLLFGCTDMRYRISVIMLVIRFLLLSLYTPLIHIIVYSVNGAKLFWLWKTYLGNYESDIIKPLGQILKWWMWSPGKMFLMIHMCALGFIFLGILFGSQIYWGDLPFHVVC